MLRKIRKMLQSQEGFTLVELMIVVVILGILAGVGIQQYGNVQQRARDAADDANRKVLTSAANMYLMFTPPAATETISAPSGAGQHALVPAYLDAWPSNPNGDAYSVQITVTPVENSTDIRYSVQILPARTTESETEG